jgi:DNA polymerase III gamma/tau subunit
MKLIDGCFIKDHGIKEIIERMSRTSTGKFKILFIENIERITGDAFHALLKTLEEGSDRLLILTTCCEITKIPATIVSR